MPLVSFVIPSYNRGQLLLSSINSILSQTFKDFEVVIVDDGSDDNTEQIIADLKSHDERIKYYKHKENLGAQAARNTGIIKAKGKWIAFCDSDDRLLPHSLELRLKEAKEKKVKAVHSDCIQINKEGFKKIYNVPPMQGKIYRQLLSRPGPLFPALLVSKDALEKIGYLDENIFSWQEWDTSIRLAKLFDFGFVSEPTFIYDCQNSDSISQDFFRDAAGYKQIVGKYWFEILFLFGPRAISRHYGYIASRYFLAGAKRYYQKYLLLSLIFWPFQFKKALSWFKILKWN